MKNKKERKKKERMNEIKVPANRLKNQVRN